jgi:hypothetical protein
MKMKTIIRLTAALFLLLGFFSGCSKNNDTQIQSYLKGKLDGVAFECTSNIRAFKPMPVPGQGDDPTLIINGDWSMYSLKLNIYGEGSSIAVGPYIFQANKNRSATLWHNGLVPYYAGNSSCLGCPIQLYGSGRITILEISEKIIKGTFEFTTAVDPVTMISKTVSEGEFYIHRN